ncbi:MAG: C40 family peptidase [Methylobacter sp.]
MTKLGKSIEAAIKQFAREEYPKEACGVITRRGKKTVAVKCANVSDAPEQRFVIASEEYQKHCDEGGVYGIWHSHVNDPLPLTPSATDIAACNMTGVDWIIIDITRPDGDRFEFGEFFFITPEDEGDDEPYVGRPYIYGIRDCFTLARDYYRRELAIDIDFRAPGYPEITNWQEQGLNLLADGYKEAGFKKLIDQEAQIGDLFLIQMSAVADHVAIYIGNDTILHHCLDRLSTTDIYGGGYWQKHTVAHLRSAQLMEKK